MTKKGMPPFKVRPVPARGRFWTISIRGDDGVLRRYAKPDRPKSARRSVIAAAFSVALSVGPSGAGAPPLLPDPALTPGAVNSAITQANMGSTLCNPHWRTGSERPDVDYTDKLKVAQLKARHYPSANKKLYEEDHLIPLEIGGNPSEPANLWPQAWAGVCGAHVKDRLENKFHDLVCAHKVALKVAQHAIATNWIKAYQKYMGPLKCP